MSKNLTYLVGKKISLKNSMDFNEKWLQDRIEEDPYILGLGNITLIERERHQSRGGRIDFLFQDDDTETLYEVEVQLGKNYAFAFICH